MSITYTYEIIKVDAQSRVMEVVYTSEGRQTMHIGARLPYVGETIESVVQMFSPVLYWREQAREVVLPDVGATGTIQSEPEPLTPPTPPSGEVPVTEI